ncbi:MAG TPA: AbrB/MazE/SpoVT family DNA-binding domain-containing protein [candidate division Zixibacteria bacterium]|nr:AbrB/MazE/SpoVT family DNA-binding domain-containing protein [candidate division Zixibacteria bacterium]
MPVKFEGSVMQVGNSLRITIPKEIAKHLNLDRGDAVELWVDNHSMMMEKKVFVYDALWAFHDDILALRKSLSKSVKAHVSQPLGMPLHKYEGQLTIERDKIMLKGEDADSNEPTSLLFSLEEVKDVYLGWDETLRQWKDTRAWIRPLRIIFQDETEPKTLYIYAKKPEARTYGAENENILQMFQK